MLSNLLLLFCCTKLFHNRVLATKASVVKKKKAIENISMVVFQQNVMKYRKSVLCIKDLGF